MRMPVLDGLELVRRWRAQEQGARLPILALSASASAASAADALASGCDAFLTKPAQLDELLDAVGRLLALEWVQGLTDTVAAGVAQVTSADDFLLAPAVATQLHQFALRGDVVSLLELARDALAYDPAAGTLLGAIRALAEQYDMRGIRQVLAAHLPPATADG